MLMSREDVAQIRPVEDIFESRQDLDPDMRSVLGRYEAIVIVSNYPKICNFKRRRSLLRSCRAPRFSRIIKEHTEH